MSNSIYQKIEEKGIQEAEKIKQEGITKANAIKQSIIDEESKRIENNKLAFNNKLADSFKTRITDLELQASKEELALKKSLIKDTFTEALTKLLELDDKSLTKLVIKLIKNASLKGNEVIQVSYVEYDRYVKLFCSHKNDLDKLNSLLGKEYHLTLSEEKANFKGGFLIISDNYDVDYSYLSLLSDLEEKLETNIAHILFD